MRARLLLPDGREFWLAERAVVLGRGEDCDIRLSAADPQLSRRHACVRCDGGSFLVEDVGSTNGVYVNEQQVTEPRQLASGDTVRLGSTLLHFHVAAAVPLPEVVPRPAVAAGPPVRAGEPAQLASQRQFPPPLAAPPPQAAAQPARPAIAAAPRPPQAQAPSLPSGVAYAGFWLRFAASLLDGLVIGVIAFALSVVIGPAVSLVLLGLGGPLGFLLLLLYWQVVGLMLGWLYFAVLESGPRQATFGKQAVGLVVTDLSGGRVSFGRASGRHFAKILSGLTLDIGFLMAGFTARKQGLHDLVSGCLVWRR